MLQLLLRPPPRSAPIRRYSALPLVFALAATIAGCDADELTSLAQPSYTVVAPATSNDVAPRRGAGEPMVILLLEQFNNQVVGCYATGEIEYVLGSHLTLLTSVLRFTPTPGPKLDSLIRSLMSQVDRGNADGRIADICSAQLSATLAQLSGL